MITWEYRIVQDEEGYAIREVFYDDTGHLAGCSKAAVVPSGQTLEQFTQDLLDYQAALRKPVLTLDLFPKASAGQIRQRKQRSRSTNISHEQLLAQLDGVTQVLVN